ncbi:MAG: hypothetical protein ABIP70_04100 [Ferruginibacter sp.]
MALLVCHQAFGMIFFNGFIVCRTAGQRPSLGSGERVTPTKAKR